MFFRFISVLFYTSFFPYINSTFFISTLNFLNIYFLFFYISISLFLYLLHCFAYQFFVSYISSTFSTCSTFSYIDILFLCVNFIFAARWHDDHARELPIGESSGSSVVLGSEKTIKSQRCHHKAFRILIQWIRECPTYSQC